MLSLLLAWMGKTACFTLMVRLYRDHEKWVPVESHLIYRWML